MFNVNTYCRFSNETPDGVFGLFLIFSASGAVISWKTLCTKKEKKMENEVSQSEHRG